MTSPTVANPRRTTLSSLAKGSDLATCTGAGGTCRNVAVRVVSEGGTRRLLCRSCA